MSIPVAPHLVRTVLLSLGSRVESPRADLQRRVSRRMDLQADVLPGHCRRPKFCIEKMAGKIRLLVTYTQRGPYRIPHGKLRKQDGHLLVVLMQHHPADEPGLPLDAISRHGNHLAIGLERLGEA